jgi:pimeloyl-ACP methyl ester carboxylesterase
MNALRSLVLSIAGLCWSLGLAAAESDVGVVLMHGKSDRPPTHVLIVQRILEERGFKVEAPLMPWSGNRQYDVDYPAALAEIDAAVKLLRDKGAKRIAVAGHSMGANAAIAYAGSGKEVDAVMALAPGHVPDLAGFQNQIVSSVAKARKMIADGEADSKAWFDDFNQGRASTVRTTARIYLSYFDPDGMAAMPKTAAAIAKPVPFLWVIGSNDRLINRGEDYVYNKVPRHESSRYLVVNGGHLDTPGIAARQISDWLASLGY